METQCRQVPGATGRQYDGQLYNEQNNNGYNNNRQINGIHHSVKIHPEKKRKPKEQHTNNIFKLLLQFSFAFLLTSAVLLLFIMHVHDDSEFLTDIRKQKQELKASIREQKLRKMQQTMFKNYRRPPDSSYNINVTLSDTVPLDRNIEDTRPDACKNIKYDLSKLPSISVVTVFYNEPVSMILRTVHSVLNRTPPELLKDVVLVNDHSTNEDLHDKLHQYVKLLPDIVQLVRTKKREGLIRARMIGMSRIHGEVVMFQDAHTEANVGWAEPMLYEMMKDPSAIVQPEVEVIDAWTLEYYKSHSTVPRGGWTWDLRYVWMEVPQHEKDRVIEEAAALGVSPTTVPFRAAALVGCAFAVRKDYFLSIGAFDEGMNVWGGENIEVAMRNWLCGGKVLTHPCTRVAHTFKPFAYKFDGDREKIVEKNLIRLAEMWMDDWKKYFLASTYSWKGKRLHFTQAELTSLDERKKIKEKLQCKSFDWYLKTITPEIPTPPTDATYYGEVTNLKTERCWETTSDDYLTLSTFCFFHRLLPYNLFYIDQHGRMHHKDQCAYVSEAFDLVRLGDCTFKQGQDRWFVEATREVEGKIKVEITRNGNSYILCATQVTNVVDIHNMDQMVQGLKCDDAHAFQSWRFHYKFDFSYDFGPLTLL